jgi:hypothetical protein
LWQKESPLNFKAGSQFSITRRTIAKQPPIVVYFNVALAS